jgi:hypothetical protein
MATVSGYVWVLVACVVLSTHAKDQRQCNLCKQRDISLVTSQLCGSDAKCYGFKKWGGGRGNLAQ